MCMPVTEMLGNAYEILDFENVLEELASDPPIRAKKIFLPLPGATKSFLGN